MEKRFCRRQFEGEEYTGDRGESAGNCCAGWADCGCTGILRSRFLRHQWVFKTVRGGAVGLALLFLLVPWTLQAADRRSGGGGGGGGTSRSFGPSGSRSFNTFRSGAGSFGAGSQRRNLAWGGGFGPGDRGHWNGDWGRNRFFSASRNDRMRFRDRRFSDSNVAVYTYPPIYPYDYGYNNNYPIVGSTYAQYYDAPLYYSDRTPRTVAAYGGTLLTEVQEELTKRGYYGGGVDGVMGPLTRNAVRAFQADHNMPATGRITEGFLARLGLR